MYGGELKGTDDRQRGTSYIQPDGITSRDGVYPCLSRWPTGHDRIKRTNGST